MAITASDIHNQSFSIDRKGYDVDEVDVFLEHVAAEIDDLNDQVARLEEQVEDQAEACFGGFDTPAAIVDDAEDVFAAPASDESSEKDELIADLQAQIAELRGQLDDSRADGNAIAQALIVAQRSADDTIAAARAKAAQIIQEAEEEADRILDDADERCQRVFDEIKELEEDREAVRATFQDMLRDFISDATNKMASIGDIPASIVPNAGHARVAAPAAAPVVEPEVVEDDPSSTGRFMTKNQAPIRQEPPVATAATYATPQMGEVVVAAADPVPGPLEKDLSGFGDIDDDFEFEDVD